MPSGAIVAIPANTLPSSRLIADDFAAARLERQNDDSSSRGHPRPEAIDKYAEARTRLLPTYVCASSVCETPARRACLDEEGDLYGTGTPGDAVAHQAAFLGLCDMCNVQL
ncbi:hypothetical protein HPB47_014168 [Ixodes persulcatus]|uniref:Uncharacterized protein n=1 Tax=Ixodes persulcatus TaxID=34615 RepID=A0AC60QWL6_IXOPE|nr:hypothetical protein HPB47_014168 [Ixodes persulcatus]